MAMTPEQKEGLLIFGGFVLSAVLCHALIRDFMRAVLASVATSLTVFIVFVAVRMPSGYDWRRDKFWLLGVGFAVFWPFMISLVVGVPFGWWRARRSALADPHRDRQ